MHHVLLLSVDTEDSGATSHNLGNHQHYNRAIAHGQSTASQVDKHGKHIWIESESENLAKTSRIPHSSTATKGENKGGQERPVNVINLQAVFCFLLVQC